MSVSKDNFKYQYPNALWYEKGNYAAWYTNGEGMPDYSEMEKMCKTPTDINIFMHDSGMAATHNMPCPVCKTKHALFVTSSGVFDVCQDCSKDGWAVQKRPTKKFWEFWK